MRTARWILLLATSATAGFLAADAGAAPPWRQINLFKRIEADPRKDYQLTEDQGPWMIMCCTFSGEGAEDEARELVLELRKRFKLLAYTYEMEFDFSQPFAGRGMNTYGGPKMMQHKRNIKAREIAVLVGDYRAVDDPDAQAVLKKLHRAQPECLQVRDDKKITRTLAGLRDVQKLVLADGEERKERGPMGHAFITANPLLPKDYFVPKGLDPFVVKLNQKIEHSLLDCPGRYSVQVALFKGDYVQTDRTDVLVKAQTTASDKLVEAAEKAHKLTRSLRAKGFEAYEFHDRYSSVVCVGSFDSLGNTGPNGRIELHPSIIKIMTTLGAQKKTGRGVVLGDGGSERVKIDGILLDPTPVPVEVPRRDSARGHQQAAR